MTDKTNDKGRRPDGAAFVIAAVLAAIGAVMLWDASRLPAASGYSGIGAGGVPTAVGWCLLGLAVWTLITGFQGGATPRPKQDVPAVLWILAGLVCQLVLLKLAGFAIATGLLFAFTAAGFGKRNLLLTIPVGVALAMGIYGVFDQILKLNLPAGPLETLLFGG